MLNNAISGKTNQGVALLVGIPKYDILADIMTSQRPFGCPLTFFNTPIKQLSIDELNELRSALTGAVIRLNNDLDAAHCAIAPSVFKIQTTEAAKELAENQLRYADAEFNSRYENMYAG